MTTYLSKQKKGDLTEMAKQAGLTGYVLSAHAQHHMRDSSCGHVC